MKRSSVYLLLLIFGIAMGFLEAIVVVYLRELYYPTGFTFPLQVATPIMASIEWAREIATITMLAAVGAIAGRSLLRGFACFLFAFGVWDIVYYLALKLFLCWPASLLTWDVLFLIPMPWFGPVLAPVICSVTMIGIAVFIERMTAGKPDFQLGGAAWALMLTGAAVILTSFIWDSISLLIACGLSDRRAMTLAFSQYVPSAFQWKIFIPGELLILASVAAARFRVKTGS